MTNCHANLWFLDVSPVSPKFGYYLTTSIGKLDDHWNDATIRFSVYAWKREAKRSLLPKAVDHNLSRAKRLFHFTASVGTLIPNPGLFYRFNLGLLTIEERCDIMVEAEIIGATSFGRSRLVSATYVQT